MPKKLCSLSQPYHDDCVKDSGIIFGATLTNRDTDHGELISRLDKNAIHWIAHLLFQIKKKVIANNRK